MSEKAVIKTIDGDNYFCWTNAKGKELQIKMHSLKVITSPTGGLTYGSEGSVELVKPK